MLDEERRQAARFRVGEDRRARSGRQPLDAADNAAWPDGAGNDSGDVAVHGAGAGWKAARPTHGRDIWAFGAVIYEMVTGMRPSKAIRRRASSRPFSRTRRRRCPRQRLAPPLLDRIVLRCLSKDPDERWQSASDLRVQLEWIKNMPDRLGGERDRHVTLVEASIWGMTIGAASVLVIGAATLMTRRLRRSAPIQSSRRSQG